MRITFYWSVRSAEYEQTMHGRSFDEALAVVTEQGYMPPIWYKPWTWENGFIIVG
jgi:hypothetical protein